MSNNTTSRNPPERFSPTASWAMKLNSHWLAWLISKTVAFGSTEIRVRYSRSPSMIKKWPFRVAYREKRSSVCNCSSSKLATLRRYDQFCALQSNFVWLCVFGNYWKLHYSLLSTESQHTLTAIHDANSHVARPTHYIQKRRFKLATAFMRIDDAGILFVEAFEKFWSKRQGHRSAQS